MKIITAVALTLYCTAAWTDSTISSSVKKPAAPTVKPQAAPDQSLGGLANTQARQLQEATKKESDRMKVLSEKSKSRHDTGNNAILNQK